MNAFNQRSASYLYSQLVHKSVKHAIAYLSQKQTNVIDYIQRALNTNT